MYTSGERLSPSIHQVAGYNAQIMDEKPRYNASIAQFVRAGYDRYNREISHRDSHVTVAGLAIGAKGIVATFTETPGNGWATYMGLQDVPQGSDSRTAYGFGILAADYTDVEVDYYTGVTVSLWDPTTKEFGHVDTIYANVSLVESRAAGAVYPVKLRSTQTLYRFEEGVALSGSQEQRWTLIEPDVIVDADHVRYIGKFDFWTKSRL